MKAITIWQPWASLILIGAKPYEFRASPYTKYIDPPKVGERIALQAGARPVRRSEVEDLIARLEPDDPEINPCLVRAIALPFLKRVLAGLPPPRRKAAKAPQLTAALFGPAVPPLDPPREVPVPDVEPYTCPLSAILCTAVLGPPKRGDICARDFGRAGNDSDRHMHFNWGWPLLDIEPVMPPVEAHGRQGFWDWNDSAYSQGGAAA
jgi:hypothetical protein